MDHLSQERRSWNMSRIKARDTKPEMIVRRLLYGMGYRYRLHCVALPGKPDIVLPGRRSVLFVHGCFWHRHDDCRFARMPSTRPDFWGSKFKANISRDRVVAETLQKDGWRVLTVWECETRKDLSLLADKLTTYLGPSRGKASC